MLPEGDLVLLEGANVGDCCRGYLRRGDVSEFCSLWLSSYQLFLGDFPEKQVLFEGQLITDFK